MAPGANTNNTGGQGNAKRQTGTVPKTKARKNSSVLPQEVVVPTRRDLQHLNDLVNNLQPEEVSLIRSRNRRTPGEGCYDLENISLHENSRFIPVRPILRRNLLHDDLDPLSHNLTNPSAIGVVIPTTPNTVHETPRVIQEANRIPDGGPHVPLNQNPRQAINERSLSSIRGNIEDRLSQIQDYIQITSGLISSIRTDKKTGEMVNVDKTPEPIDSTNLETLANSGSESEINGPRPQSVTSIHSTPDTPILEELQQRLGVSSRNMQNIKEQQQQLMRLQQVAKQQLQEMEQVRVQNPLAPGQSYDSVEAVQDDVSNLMTRMQALTNFIHGQNDMASLLGEDAAVAMAEQTMLQKKLQELKERKQQMEKLVDELQNMNVEADRAFAVNGAGAESLERIVPIELLGVPQDTESETENDEGQSEIGDKIAEINAMKDQLNHLKDLMETVKLIEMKTNEEKPDMNNLSSNAKVSNADFERPVQESELSDRVQALHAMTQDLREQALSLVSERERLKSIKDEMERRRDDALEKTSNQSGSTIREVSPVPEHQRLKEEYDAKKKEYEKIVEKLQAEQRRVNPKQVSADSTDTTMPIDAASLKSGSTKSLPQIGMDRSAASGASGGAWRKVSHENVEMSPHPTNHFSPCNSFYAAPTQPFCPPPPTTFNVDQSPQCHHHHDPFAVYPAGRGDSLLLQQFIQTQQMLINSVSQCNQLLWSQQRELNNLNNAVLLLQERLLKQDDGNAALRAESVPPNAAGGAQMSTFLQRAQSEQPNFFTGTNQFPQPLSPVRVYPNYQNQPVLRNQPNNNRVARVAGNVQQSQPNGFYGNGGEIFGNLPFGATNATQGTQQPALLNNNPNSLLNAQTTSTPIFIHHNNNTSGGNNASNLNVTNTAFATHVPPQALNNQVAPGNRANNYWDNFRSYSRQNLLSGNSCKSNEDSCSSSSSNFPFNTDHRAPHFRNQPNNLPVLENKFEHHHFRNEVNQVNCGPIEPTSLPQEVHVIPGTIGDVAHLMNPSDVLGFHTNPINLGVSEFSAKSKTQANKGNGNKKRSRRTMDRNILGSNPDCVAGDDRNLASASSGRNTKSTSKFFEELKENVYMEVSALIAANELRPYFLIQLFRDLQLMSSDPMRQQTLQSIQDLYNRYVESTIHVEAEAYGSSGATNPIDADNLSNVQEQEQQPDTRTEHFDFQSSTQSTPARSAENPVQPDYDMLRIVAQEVSEFLQTVDIVNEAALQRIGTIVLTHLNNSINEKLTLSKYYINQEEFMHHLSTFNRSGDKEELLGSIENYLTGLMIPSAVHDVVIHADCIEGAVGGVLTGHPSEMEGYLQIVTPQNQRRSQDNLVDVSSVFESINGDLAEADQVCSSESLYEEEVHTTSTVQQADQRRDEETVWISDEEVEILSTNGNTSNGTEGKH
uniref:Putative cdc7 family protein kinase n=1 Tax=Nyssomyia neivai TaxID=330878 RepID=A0A1L8DN79_9DIPT